MKIIWTIIRWLFGLTFCLASIGGFASGDTGLALFVLALGLLLLPPVTKALFNRKQRDTTIPTQTQTYQPKPTPVVAPTPKPFQSQINRINFPDRVDAIVWHINSIDKGLASGDLELANLSYAKLIESIRQQNVNEKGNYEDALKTIRDEYEQFRMIYGLEYPPQFLPPTQRKKAIAQTTQATSSSAGVVINPGTTFKLTLYNAPNDIIQQVKKILADENNWNKEKQLMPLFTQYNIKCREIDEYVSKYKPIYLSKVEELKKNSSEYQNASEMDKQDIEGEFYETAANSLYEKAACDIDLLFSADDIDITMDDELIKDYGFDTISKYIGFAYDFDKVRIDYERKDFEDLIQRGLAVSGEEIPASEILKQQPLKLLNKIANKEEGFFKRKDKAIDFITADDNLKKSIGNHVSMRRIFKLKPLPDKYKELNLNELSSSWGFVKEQIKLIVDTYRDAQRYTEDIKGDLSWTKGFRIEKFEDLNSNFVCLRAREECKKKYSKSNPPKLPLHIGCNCDLRTEI